METTDWFAIGLLAFVLLVVFVWLQRPAPGKIRTPRRQIAVDGTNVLFWRDNKAQLSTLQVVVKRLQKHDFDPVVFLDASSRHHIGDRALNERKFAQILGISQNRVMVCPARTEADAFILEYAGAQKLAVVSNDRFRDRPREARNIKLIKGRFEGATLVLKGM